MGVFGVRNFTSDPLPLDPSGAAAPELPSMLNLRLDSGSPFCCGFDTCSPDVLDAVRGSSEQQRGDVESLAWFRGKRGGGDLATLAITGNLCGDFKGLWGWSGEIATSVAWEFEFILVGLKTCRGGEGIAFKGLVLLTGLPAFAALLFCIGQRLGGLGCFNFASSDDDDCSFVGLLGDADLRGLRLRDRGECSEGGITLTTRTGVMTLQKLIKQHRYLIINAIVQWKTYHIPSSSLPQFDAQEHIMVMVLKWSREQAH